MTLLRFSTLCSILCLSACATGRSTASRATLAPRVDYHQHLVSGNFAPIAKHALRDGRMLLAELDSAGIEKAVVLSVAYTYGDERKHLPDPDGLARTENDWTSRQVAASGGRLVGFCSANPLRDAGVGEIARCLGLPGMRGIKLHLGNSGISLRDSAQAARVALVFRLAEQRRVAVLVHMRARGGANYGAEDARLFLDKLVALAPSIDVVVAHLGASGPGYSAQNDSVMAEFGAAAERGDPRMRNVYFDVSSNVAEETTPQEAALVARRLRQVGVQHVLYGSDLGVPGGTIKAGWELFRTRTPLTADELRTIAGNVRPFVR